MTFYDRVNRELKNKKKTRKELCIATGLSYSTVASLFNRKSKNIGIDTIRLIANYLELSVDYLIGNDPLPKNYVGEDDSIIYHSSEKNMLKEVVRIFEDLDIQGKTRLLSTAYELEAKYTHKFEKN